MSRGITQGFVLGAGLGTRLRPLTDSLPKPLLPIFEKPLVTFALDHLMAAGIRRFVINTHHLPETWNKIFPEASYRGCPLRFRHEPELLETGGGIRNVRDLLGEEPFLTHNGDTLADLDLESLIAAHQASGNAATLGLRSSGGPKRVCFDATTGLIHDLRGTLGVQGGRACVFTGIAVLTPRIFDFLPPEGACSVIPAFVEMIRAGLRVGGVLLDEGEWSDVGTPDAYRDIHRRIARGLRFSHGRDADWPSMVDPSAVLGEGALLEGWNAIGAGTRIGENSRLEDCILWAGAKCAPEIHLKDCIVRASAKESAASRIF